MNTFFLDNFISNRELNYLAKEVKRKQLNKTIYAIGKLNEHQTNIIKEQNLNTSQYFQKKMSERNAKRYL